MDTDEEVATFREYAERCRKIARSSRNSKEWIAMAEQWEHWLIPQGMECIAWRKRSHNLKQIGAPRKLYRPNKIESSPGFAGVAVTV